MVARLLLSVVTIIFYFFLSLLIPVLGYLVPQYKIKKVETYGKKYVFIINILVAMVLLLISEDLLIIYLIFPYATEFLFFFFNKLCRPEGVLKKLKLYDRIVLTSIITTFLVFFYVYLNKERIVATMDEIILLASKQQELASAIVSLKENLIYISDNIVSIIFKYMLLTNIFLFLVLIPSTYKLWRLSCYWLLPFIFFILGTKFLNINADDFIVKNIMDSITYMYLWYGIKNIYSITESFGVKTNLVKHGVSIILGLYFPIPVFILGALASFEVIEFKEIRI